MNSGVSDRVLSQLLTELDGAQVLFISIIFIASSSC